MPPGRDEPCPARGPLLAHFAEFPSYVCQECGQQCLIEEVVLVIAGNTEVHHVDEMPCILDHDALISGRRGVNESPIRGAGDTGTEWSTCHQCGVMVEQKQDMIGPQGEPWGIGRTSWAKRRQEDELAQLQFMRWYYHEKVEL